MPSEFYHLVSTTDASSFAASIAICTSEPVASNVMSREPTTSTNTYAPRAQRFSSVWAVRTMGKFCLERHNVNGADMPTRAGGFAFTTIRTLPRCSLTFGRKPTRFYRKGSRSHEHAEDWNCIARHIQRSAHWRLPEANTSLGRTIPKFGLSP
jgi:hypothetical protein